MSNAKPNVAAVVAGIVFGVGLGISHMTMPSKILAFLDVAGHWDPSLALVMAGAVIVHFVGLRLVARRRTPLFTNVFYPPTQTAIDKKLVAGAAIFGVGWGLSGLCPGPAVVSAVGAGVLPIIVFVGAMLMGMALEGSMRNQPGS